MQTICNLKIKQQLFILSLYSSIAQGRNQKSKQTRTVY